MMRPNIQRFETRVERFQKQTLSEYRRWCALIPNKTCEEASLIKGELIIHDVEGVYSVLPDGTWSFAPGNYRPDSDLDLCQMIGVVHAITEMEQILDSVKEITYSNFI